MSKKSIVLSVVFAILTIVFLILTIKAGGADAGFTPLTFVFGFLTFKYIRKVLDQKKGITREKKLPTVATVGIILIISLALSVVSIFIGTSLCISDECDNKALDDFSYCEEHKCINNSCGEEKIKSFEYCSSCKCQQEDCAEYNDGDMYCEKHECSDSLCDEAKENGKEFCAKHKDCYFDDCSNPKVKGFKYCEKHKCAISDCEYDIGINTKYCGDHGCRYDGCSSLKINNGSSCSKHKCSTSDCKNVKEEGKSKCSSCIAKAEAEAEYREENAAYLDKLIVNTNGKQLWKVYIKDTFRIEADYSGSGNFIIWLLDSNQEEYDLLCNEIGSYKLNTTRNVPDGYYYIKIESTYGSWNAKWYGTYGK